jgi:hypothetical protein
MRAALCTILLIVFVGTIAAQQRFSPDGRLLSPEETKKVLAAEAKQTADLKVKLGPYVKAIEKGLPDQIGKSSDGFRREHVFGRILEAKLFDPKLADKPYGALVHVEMMLEESKTYPTREAAAAAEFLRKTMLANQEFFVTFHQSTDGSWVPYSLIDGHGYMASDKVNADDFRWRMFKAPQSK